MNTNEKVRVLQRDAAHMAQAIMAMNSRIAQLEHLKQPLATRVWKNLTGIIKRVIS